MSFANKTETLKYLLELIINGNTGPAEDLCQRILCFNTNTTPVFIRPA